METNGLEIWQAIQNKYEAPSIEMSIWSDAQETVATNDTKAMNVLFSSSDMNEFSGIMLCKTAYDIWQTL